MLLENFFHQAKTTPNPWDGGETQRVLYHDKGKSTWILLLEYLPVV